MLFEIILCFFTVFGIMQIMLLLWEMFFSKIPPDATLLVKVDENTDFYALCLRLKKQKINVVLVYDDIDVKKLETLKKDFDYVRFVSKEGLTNELIRVI